MLALLVAFLPPNLLVEAFTSYPNDFVDPDYILSGNFPPNTGDAQKMITQWALELASKGPWSVMNKTVVPPSGDMHDYRSWAPYSWPNCTGVRNTTELSPQQIWKECLHETRDGMFNPDGRLINDVGAFSDLADAVLYNSISHTFQGQPTSLYSQNVINFLKVWLLNNDIRMNSNLNYAQMKRGPDGQVEGAHCTSVTSKCFTKIASGILILRQGLCVDYTSEVDSQVLEWSGEYITWLESAAIALEEGESANNHGTFYYNQPAALKIIVNDLLGALNATDTYFRTLYPSQIEASGEQPLEASRTPSYHYRAYNLAAMITNARLAAYAAPSSPVWNNTSSGATIKTALNYAKGISANSSGENSYSAELYPSMAAVASIYGDEDGRYASFLNAADSGYAEQPYFLWNQPLAGGTVATADSGTPNNGLRTPLARVGWLELAIGVAVGLART
ncbi:chondroitin AC/alginate lyase [Desarmillaria ectypa]|nr:chondroitin AC/alginate lyase [Desarmillaria ectypa]